jgi:organic radical activating enzyme
MKISEIFYSAQGEGIRTGVLSTWVRFAGCNLRCQGFFQRDPTMPGTFINPIEGVDPKTISKIEDLPVVKYGCDTIYAIDPRFKHLFKDMTVDEVVQQVLDITPGGSDWQHPISKNGIDLCITGGEPMLYQDEVAQIIKKTGANNIQIETNGTRKLENNFIELYKHGSNVLFWNISPKLFHVSGESDDKTWKPEVIRSYFNLSNVGCLKFVINDREDAWNELNSKVKTLRNMDVYLPVYVMPVGSTYEQQTNTETLSKIATRAVNEGYHLSSRLQSIFWGNTVGV